MHTLNWITWAIIFVLVSVGTRYKIPNLIRIAHHMIAIRTIWIAYKLEGKSNFNDLAKLVENSQIQVLGMQLLVFIPFSLTERAIVHVPFSLVYNLFLHFGQLAIFYQYNSKEENYFKFVYEHKLTSVVKITLI